MEKYTAILVGKKTLEFSAECEEKQAKQIFKELAKTIGYSMASIKKSLPKKD